MRRFARWHIWLGWVVALPVLLWIASGLFMAAKPIEEVRGEDLRRPAVAVKGAGLVFPVLTQAVTKVSLIDEASRAVWIVSAADKSIRRFDARSGAALGAVDESEARRIALATFAGKAPLQTMVAFAADQPPLDLRKARPSWQATFADGTHLYIDAESGEVLALRTRWWRAYDLLWGLHIMDPGGRENAHNPWLLVLGTIAFGSSLLGAVLLFRRRRIRG